jgi:proline iminopeptidase
VGLGAGDSPLVVFSAGRSHNCAGDLPAARPGLHLRCLAEITIVFDNTQDEDAACRRYAVSGEWSGGLRILVNGVRLFVDVANPGLVPDGLGMREKPTLLMLHGGPGFDHVPFKDAFSALSDVAQVIFYDHRGNGRSEGDDPSTWNLAQWGDDVKGLCDALGIVKPIVCGLSFGGFVAQSYATRYPEHPGKLILLSTAAQIDFPTVFKAFARIGGPEIGALAESYWTNPTAEGRAVYRERCVPFYLHRRDRSAEPLRAIMKDEVALRFNGPRNEHGRFDFHADLAKVACPVLMIGGEYDPIVPISLAEATAHSLPAHLVRFERLANCGHDIHGDDPESVFSLIREFIADIAPATATA